MFTKWDLITETERLELEKIEFRSPCAGCQEWLETEADFAKHFVLPNSRYKNLGECPKVWSES